MNMGESVSMVQFVQALVKDGVVAHLAPDCRAPQDVFLSMVLGERGLATETI